MEKKFYLLFVLLIAAHPFLGAQTVSTVSSGLMNDGISYDSQGNIYASYFNGGHVLQITPEGEVNTFVQGLGSPNGLAMDSNDNLYVCDWQANRIRKYDRTGMLINTFNVSGNPSGIIKAFDSDDMIFTHYRGNTLSRLSSDGVITSLSNASELNGPVGLAYDENGTLYVGNYNNRIIYRVNDDGTLNYIAQLPSSGGSLPHLGFITYAHGRIYGTILSNHRIYSVNPNEVDDYLIFAGSSIGSTDGALSQATFNNPNGILYNPSNNAMYITDYGTRNLRIIGDVVSSNTELSEKNFRFNLGPIPLKDKLRFSAYIPVNTEKWELKVYDIFGKVLIQASDLSTSGHLNKTIDVNHLNSGIYLVELNLDGHSAIQKVCK